MRIRRGGEEDAAGIARLHVASWQATYRDELPAAFLDGQDVDARRGHWEAEVRGGTGVLVAEDRGDLVGFVAFGPARDEDADASRTFQIHNLHAAPSRHGRGIGRALFEDALAEARAHGAREVTLWVVETNANARRFYERQGMEPDGARRTQPVGDGAELREVRYRCRLEADPESDGVEDWKLLQPVERERRKSEDIWGRLGAATGILIGAVFGLGAMLAWYCSSGRERAAAVRSQRQLESGSEWEARRTAEREIQLLLRPIAHEGNIGGDQSVRRFRLGMAYGRLALIEERAGNLQKRDGYFDLARRALRDAGVKDATDDFIRHSLRTGPAPR
jgi:ribosomal protein S18 acetylase RimI-like enzyme